MYKTMGDTVREHCNKIEHAGSTTDAMELLELRDIPENILAANFYLTALEMINKLQKQLDERKSE